jgi:hypothetical protein
MGVTGMWRMLTFRRAAMLALGTVALVGAGVGSASADTTVQVRLPNGVHAKSLYVYQGGGPAGNSNWDHCFAAGGQVVVPATPGQVNIQRCGERAGRSRWWVA